MNIKNHLFIGLILSFVLLPFFGFYSFFILIPSVLLDLDHYFLSFIKTKKFNIKKSIDYHKNGCGKHSLCIFHTVEFLISLGILSFFSKIIFWLFIGTFLHLFIDYLDWFVWFSYYSERTPSIILAPLVSRRGKFFNKKIKRLGRKCIVCGFDKAWDSHFIIGYGEVMLCPNHHFIVHKGLISDDELLKTLKDKKLLR